MITFNDTMQLTCFVKKCIKSILGEELNIHMFQKFNFFYFRFLKARGFSVIVAIFRSQQNVLVSTAVITCTKYNYIKIKYYLPIICMYL